MTKENKTTEFDLNMHTARLLMAEPFFASLSRRIDKKKTRSIPTAGVRVNPTTAQFELFYNPDFMASLTDVQKLGVLKHEFYHIIFQHVTSRRPEGKMTREDNIQMDLAINSNLIGELPDDCCMPGVGPYEWAPVGKSYEWYKANWQEPEEDESEQGEGEAGEGEGQQGSFDDHSQWGGEGTEEGSTANEIAKERLKEALKEAVEEASKSSGWGSVSAQTRKEIIDRLKVKVDWKKALRYFVKTSQRAAKKSTVRRLNHRFPYIHSGKKVTRTASIAIAIDQSGSVSDTMLIKFFSALDGLSKIATFDVIPFDSEIQEDHIYTWKKGKRHDAKRVSCGGTSFHAVTDYINKCKKTYDGVIMLTDLEAEKPHAIKCKRMWMTTPEYAERPYFSTKEIILVID